MPYEIRPHGGQYCVFKKGATQPIKGGCHSTREKAVAHRRALEANVEDAGAILPALYAHQVDLFAEGGEVRNRALAGEPILILPQGTFWRWGESRDVTEQTIGEFVDNWRHRTERGIRRSRLAVDIDHDGRAVGWYADVMALPNGLGATFRWTDRGRQALEGDEYAYFSPTIYWEITDRQTNEVVTNQVAGGALTNYPFFGEATALFAGLRNGDERVIRAMLDRQYGGIAMPDQGNQDGNQEREGLQGVIQAFNERLDQLFARFNQEGEDPSAGQDDLGALQEQVADLVSQFSDVQSSLEAVTEERDEYRQQVERLQESLISVSDARERERFSAMAETYAYLPVETPGLAEHLRWLYGADTTDEQAHAAFFAELLQAANEAFSRAFEDRSVGSRNAGDAMVQIDAAVKQYIEEHPSTSYSDALSVVMAERPDLYRLYQQERGGER